MSRVKLSIVARERLDNDPDAALALAPTGPSSKPVKPGRGIARLLAAFVAGCCAVVALAALLVSHNLLPDRWTPQNPTTTSPDVALANARAHGTLKSILAVGKVSPRGRPSTGVNAAVALELADRHLHGIDLPRDQGEASFWLRHAMSLPLETDSMLWAVTQLGVVHASPDGFEPDYAKARVLWELASTFGDPIAMCFQATLYEHGLGVVRHKALARAWYERARFNGGCPDLEAALERTR